MSRQLDRQGLNLALSAFSRSHAGLEATHEALEGRIVELYGIATGMMSDVAQHIRSMNDSELDRLTADRAEELSYPAQAETWMRENGPDSLSDEAVARSILVELRALDKSLYELRDKASRSSRPGTDYRVRGTDWYLIPVPALQNTAKSFTRSSFKHHRVLPAQVDGLPVTLYTGPVVGRSDPSFGHVTGAIFEPFRLDVAPSTPGAPFHATGLGGGDQAAQVDRHMAKILGAPRQFAVVWPELTVPPHLRVRIATALKDGGLSDVGSRPVLVVTGTWHESLGSAFVNRGHVLDGNGREILHYDKRKRFEYDGRPEDIRSGREIPVLIVGDQLICFAVCLDFCNGLYERAYPRLAVDLMIVPSMGGSTTITGHRDAADESYLRQGTDSLVVQQLDAGATPAFAGYVYIRSAGDEGRTSAGVCFRTI